MLGIFVVVAINSHQLDEPARLVLIATPIRQHYGAETTMEMLSATRAVFTTNYITSVYSSYQLMHYTSSVL